ncbi:MULTISPECIES: endonuclease NucS domain-containing protein [unclassified Mesorhizobium]|uniref:endonuclease NucS domain-containing protein n=1 Tax=unclassified Mesorhizobium TaxID=325217 RepID=UPI0030151529
MRQDYKNWLEEQKYSSGTVTAQLHRVGRVEDSYGSLDEHFANGTLQQVIDELNYSTHDERASKPNPSKIPFEGNIRNNLQSYKNAVVRYRKFLTGWDRADSDVPEAFETVHSRISMPIDQLELPAQKLSLERDMQAALRRNIGQLGGMLSIVDDGAERSVHSGFIDITCADKTDNALVVVELKAGKADSRAIGQILGYMGDLAEEEEGRAVRGILVAHEFDKRSRSAAKVVPTLSLMRYAVDFRFEPEE